MRSVSTEMSEIPKRGEIALKLVKTSLKISMEIRKIVRMLMFCMLLKKKQKKQSLRMDLFSKKNI
jgi:hypothetical protein